MQGGASLNEVVYFPDNHRLAFEIMPKTDMEDAVQINLKDSKICVSLSSDAVRSLSDLGPSKEGLMGELPVKDGVILKFNLEVDLRNR